MRIDKILYLISITLLAMSLFACGGGGSGEGGGNVNSQSSMSSSATVSFTSSSNASSQVDEHIRKYTESRPIANIWGVEFPSKFSELSIDGLNFYNSDGTHGVTKLINEGSNFSSSFIAREGGTTYFNLGTIEFYPVPSSRIISIFNLLHTYNHRSNEVVNLVRLLMLLNEGNSFSKKISISEESKSLIKSENIVLSDLFVDVNEFHNLDKITNLTKKLNVSSIPSVDEASNFITYCFIESLQKNGDFDFDNVINSNDDFPFDNTQWRDSDNSAIGDDVKVEYKFIETRGVVKYLVDSKNRFLYVANYNKKLLRYDLVSGGLLSEIVFDDYIISMDINGENGDVFVATAEKYIYEQYRDSTFLKSEIFVIHSDGSGVSNSIVKDIYARDIKVVNNRFVLVSALNNSPSDARIVVFDTSDYRQLQDLRYFGEGGRIVSGKSKFIVIHHNIYTIFTIGDAVSYYGQGGLNAWVPMPVFIYDEADSLIDVNGFGFRLTLTEGESLISDAGTHFINYQYLDVANYRVSPSGYLVKEDLLSNQYFVLGLQEIFYVNMDTLLVSGKRNFNRYSGQSGYEQGAKRELAVIEDKVYVISELSNGATQISSFTNPCISCGSSNPPIAAVTVDKNYIDIQEPIQLNAHSSYDLEDGDKLRFRWDLNSDGVWDTNFTFNSQYAVKFETAGKKMITLQVMDSSGLAAEKSISLDLSFGAYLGVVPESEKLEDLDVLVEDAEYDQLNNIVYLTSPETLSILAIDASSGKVIRQYRFKYQPTQMALSSVENILYVGFNGKGCFGGPPLECEKDLFGPENGFVLKFDLNRKAFFESFEVSVPPADLYIKGNELFVSSHYWFEEVSSIEFLGGIDVYNKITGELVDHISTGSGANGLFDKIIKVTDAPLFDSQWHGLVGLDYISDPQKTVVYVSESYMQHKWLKPDSDLVINSIGEIRDIKSLELIHSLNLYDIKSISFDVGKNLMIIGTSMDATTPSKGALEYYDLDSYEHLGTTATDNWPDWIFSNNGKVISIERIGNYQYKVSHFDAP